MPEFPFHSQALTFPRGFRAAAARGGLKTEGPDVALIVGDDVCAAAGVFTQDLFVGAPVVVSREHIADGRARAIVVNSGCANAVTGVQGLADARQMVALAAEAVGCNADEVLVASTGVIGHMLPMDKLETGIRAAALRLSADNDADAAPAIMTTDLRPKTATAEFELGGKTVRIGGICKGSGMIAPNMATMLGFLTTDAAIEPAALQAALVHAVKRSFNAVTVDGDTSTNDTVFLLASGAAGNELIRSDSASYWPFVLKLTNVCQSLAKQIAWDGEGATKLVYVEVLGAEDEQAAAKVGRTIAESPLTKTALFGNDPNWGRILAAAGRAGVPFDPDKVELRIGSVLLVENGQPVAYDETAARDAIAREEVEIGLHLHGGTGRATIYTCDFSYDYVRINAEYHT